MRVVWRMRQLHQVTARALPCPACDRLVVDGVDQWPNSINADAPWDWFVPYQQSLNATDMVCVMWCCVKVVIKWRVQS